MRDREMLGRVVVIKTRRKHGNGAVGGGRKNSSGKTGIIYQVGEDGKRTELARANGTTFTDLSRQLFKTELIPRDVTINSSGETAF